MQTKYLIEHRLFKQPITICFNEFGVLSYYDGLGLDQKQSEWFLQNIPIRESMMDGYKKKYATQLRISKATNDISFDAAYNAYNYKVGKKEKAKKLWEKMSENDMHLFFRMLPEYTAYLTKTGTAKAYFETFLNNQYYKNDYKTQL